jgi:hypothetical protein
MEKLHFNVTINAPRQKVWDVMFADKTYREWTTPFSPEGVDEGGSRFEGSWNKGSTIKFLASIDGKEGGMYSRIAKNVPYEFLSIEHLGIIVDGKVDTESPEARKWSPAFENYTFKDAPGGGTELLVDLDAEKGEFADMFKGVWPTALAKLKEIAER